MRKSLGRRIALRRPQQAEIERARGGAGGAGGGRAARRGQDHGAARQARAQAAACSKTIAYIDPIDLQYNRFERVPKPTTQAVMFCLMDASASMTEPLKDLAKRFFMLLHVFLTRYYREVDVVFIRHTATAAGGGRGDLLPRHRDRRHGHLHGARGDAEGGARALSPADWNIYAAQASDGDNFHDDMPRCLDLLDEEILPLCQYFAYIETTHGERFNDTHETPVWHGYTVVAGRARTSPCGGWRQPEDIFPVFHELFSQRRRRTAALGT